MPQSQRKKDATGLNDPENKGVVEEEKSSSRPVDEIRETRMARRSNIMKRKHGMGVYGTGGMGIQRERCHG